MTRRIALLAFVVSAAVSATAMARQQGVDPRLVANLDGRLRASVVAVVDSAQRQGLPTEPLIDMAMEAINKRTTNPRISDAAIVSSVSGLMRDLRTARAALGPKSTPADIKAAAYALRSGLDVRQLERVRTAKGDTRIATALEVLTYISRLGVHPDSAANVIVNLVAVRASDDQLLALKDDVERDVAGGTSAALAMAARGEGLAAQIHDVQANNGGARGAALPSGLGSTRAADPTANGALGAQVQGNVTPGSSPTGGSKPAPVGKPKKP